MFRPSQEATCSGGAAADAILCASNFAPHLHNPSWLPRRQQPEAALQLLTAAQEPSGGDAAAPSAAAALHPSAVLLARTRAALLHGRMADTAGAMSELVRHKMRVAQAFTDGGAAGGATPSHVQLMTQVCCERSSLRLHPAGPCRCPPCCYECTLLLQVTPSRFEPHLQPCPCRTP